MVGRDSLAFPLVVGARDVAAHDTVPDKGAEYG